MRDYFHIAYVTDNGYAMPTHISILSLLRNKKEDVRYFIHIVGDGVEEKHIKNFFALKSDDCKIQYIEADASSYASMIGKSTRTDTYISDSAMLKFSLPNLLEDVDIALYLDGDTMVTADISELFDMNMDEYYVGGVDVKCPEQHIPLPDGCYFNSGVMLLNLRKMREDHVTEKLIDYKMSGINFYMDQDAFNAVLLDKTVFLPAEYNFFGNELMCLDFPSFNERFFERRYANEHECLQAARILHINGKLKPWKYSLPYFDAMFDKYYQMSRYRQQVLPKKSPIPILLKEQKQVYHSIMRKLNWKLKFPKESVAGKRVALYGAGEVGKVFHQCLKDIDCEEVIWVDSNWKSINNEEIYSPDSLTSVSFDCVLIAIYLPHIIEEVQHFLEDMGIVNDRIVHI